MFFTFALGQLSKKQSQDSVFAKNMSSSGDKTALLGKLWKFPASFWGAEWSNLVDSDP